MRQILKIQMSCWRKWSSICHTFILSKVVRWLLLSRKLLGLLSTYLPDSGAQFRSRFPRFAQVPVLSLTLPFSFTAGDVGLGEGPEWQPAGEAHGQSPPRTDSQSGDCLGRIMGIWGRSAIQALSQRLLSVWLDAGFREKGILSSGLSFHKAFHSNNFMNTEGRVRLEILPQGL